MASATPLTPIPYPHLKGKPHWQRTLSVYVALDNAPTDATYEQLIEWVEEKTGKRCSRKLISKWKEEQHLRSQEPEVRSQLIEPLQQPTTQPSESPKAISLDSRRQHHTPTVHPATITHKKPNWLNRIATVGAITTTIVGLGWLLTPEDKYKPLAIAESPSVQTTPLPKKPPALEPREIKIELSLTSPKDLKVKPGDKISPGQILSDRTTERQRLLNQKRQLELSLKQLEIAIPAINAPKSVPVLRSLPPVSYQQEEANISLKQQELREAQKAIAHQQEKIKQLTELLPKAKSSPDINPIVSSPSSPEISELPQDNNQTSKPLPLPSPTFLDLESKPVTLNSPQPSETQPETPSNNPVATIIEHEQAILKQLEDNREKAQLELQIAQSQLKTAKEKRQQDEYQLYLEENRRMIALQNQQIELERQRTIRAGQLQEKTYSKAQIQAKIQEVDNAIAQLSTVKAPYSGTVKKVKWKGQTDRTLTVELTLDVDDGSTSRTATMSR